MLGPRICACDHLIHKAFKQSLAPSSHQQILTHGVPLPHQSIAIKLPWREHLWGSPVVQWWPGSEAYSKKAFFQVGQHLQPLTKSLTMIGISEPSQLKKPWLLHLLWSTCHADVSSSGNSQSPKHQPLVIQMGKTINNAGRWNGDSVCPWLPIYHHVQDFGVSPPPCRTKESCPTDAMWFMYCIYTVYSCPQQPACQAHCKLQRLRWSRGLTFWTLLAWQTQAANEKGQVQVPDSRKTRPSHRELRCVF